MSVSEKNGFWNWKMRMEALACYVCIPGLKQIKDSDISRYGRIWVTKGMILY